MPAQGLAWMAYGACLSVPGLPWTVDTDRVSDFQAARMRSVCGGCPVRRQCEQYAAATGVEGGWWAGADTALFGWAPSREGVEQGLLPISLPQGGAAA